MTTKSAQEHIITRPTIRLSAHTESDKTKRCGYLKRTLIMNAVAFGYTGEPGYIEFKGIVK